MIVIDKSLESYKELKVYLQTILPRDILLGRKREYQNTKIMAIKIYKNKLGNPVKQNLDYYYPVEHITATINSILQDSREEFHV